MARAAASWIHVYRKANGERAEEVGLTAEEAIDRLTVLRGYIEPVYEPDLPRAVLVDELPLTNCPETAAAPLVPESLPCLSGDSRERPAASYPVAQSWREFCAREALAGVSR